MPTAFNVTQWQVGDTNYVVTYNANLLELALNAVHKDDIAGYVAMGGDPATVEITTLKNNNLNEGEVAGRPLGVAAGQPVQGIDIRLLQYQAAVIAFRESRSP